jgi:hypothetical protein
MHESWFLLHQSTAGSYRSAQGYVMETDLNVESMSTKIQSIYIPLTDTIDEWKAVARFIV